MNREANIRAQKKGRSVGGSLLSLIILLVIVQMFLEAVATAFYWSANIKNALTVSGFVFDLFFTIEFLIRLFTSFVRRDAKRYFFSRMGWIDFLASVPLLVFTSGPALLAMIAGVTLTGGGRFFNILKLVRAVRMARVLRLLRALRIIPEIKNKEAVMTQRHVTRIAAMIIVVATVAVMGMAAVGIFVNIDSPERQFEKRIAMLVDSNLVEENASVLIDILPELLVYRYNGILRYSKYAEEFYADAFSLNDYQYVQIGDHELFLDLRQVHSIDAFYSLRIYVVLLLVFVFVVFWYGSHFAYTITDPIHVVYRGMTEQQYDLRVRVLPEYKNDEIFKLAAAYNRDFLAMKASSDVAVGKGLLDIGDITMALEEEDID